MPGVSSSVELKVLIQTLCVLILYLKNNCNSYIIVDLSIYVWCGQNKKIVDTKCVVLKVSSLENLFC